MTFTFFRLAVASCAAALISAACAAGQVPAGSATAVISEVHSARYLSPLPHAGAILVYATGGCGGACILSYPDGNLVAQASINGLVNGDCSDSNGNVFITNDTQVQEYTHGGTSPVATLALPGTDANACSIDPTTGNLAVVFSSGAANVAVYLGAKGAPVLYVAPILPQYCGYDGSGNLFVSGEYNQKSQLAELPYGLSYFSTLSISQNVGAPGQVQWDGKYITYEGRSPDNIRVSRLVVSGSSATIVGVTRFKTNLRNAYQSWIYNNRILLPYSTRGQSVNHIALWAYPKGKRPIGKFKFGQTRFTKFAGVTVST